MFSSLRTQTTEKLRELGESVAVLLASEKMLSIDLVVKLQTLGADITAILEDREDEARDD
jgi:hypothetical protein